MKWKGLPRRSSWQNFRPRVRGLCQACLTTTDVVNPKHSNNAFLEKEEINHKEIRLNALQLKRKGMITSEEYAIVLDADLKYEAGLNVELSTIQLDMAPPALTPRPLPPSCLSPCPSPCPSPSLVDLAASMYPPLAGVADPITLEELGDNTFTFVTPHGKEIKYNIESLVEYIASSGDFRDPVTRVPLSPDDILAIDEQIAADEACQHLSSLKSIRENAHVYCIEKQKQEECQNLETCLGEMVVDMLEIIQNPTMGPKTSEAAEMRMCMLFSEFESPFQVLKSLNIEQARHSLLCWQVFLRGPAKKPTKPRGPPGILQTALTFLEGQWLAADDTKLKMFQATFEK